MVIQAVNAGIVHLNMAPMACTIRYAEYSSAGGIKPWYKSKFMRLGWCFLCILKNNGEGQCRSISDKLDAVKAFNGNEI